MDKVEKKLKILKINTELEPRPTRPFTEPKQKRFSTPCLVDTTCPITPTAADNSDGHKRSVSVGNETIFLPRNQSVPNLLSRTTTETKKSLKKKKWFQLPSIGLKRQTSTPPKRGYGGLKAGLVEPPEPPPQLLFNLNWSSNNLQPLEWDNLTPSTEFSLDLATPTTLEDENSATIFIRRGSCPLYTRSPTDISPSSPTYKLKSAITAPNTPTNTKLFPNLQRPILRRGTSNDMLHSITPSASSSTSSTTSIPSTTASTIITPLHPTNEDHPKPVLSNVYEPQSNQIIIRFDQIKSRTNKLKRKSNIKNELKALHIWQNELLETLNNINTKSTPQHVISSEKTERYIRTRRFILREFYTTEINFWNQLNYTKVMFSDPLQLAVDRHSDVARSSDIDLFGNLHDLMKFSSSLIIRLRNAQIQSTDGTDICKDTDIDPSCQTCPNDVNIGYVLCDMAESMVTFLRCAVDYRANKKTLDQRIHNKAYALYNEKLALRKETRQFKLHDYLIIPIQRITRYGLLLADLEKHTESTHPDYYNIRIARSVVHSLAVAMNSAQKK